jgi:hypothetical protein
MGDALYAAVPLRAEDADTQNVFHCKIFFAWLAAINVFTGSKRNKNRDEGKLADPSFTGIKIPETPNPPDSGIDVKWKYLNRNNPMVWNDQLFNLQTSGNGS